MEEFYFPVHIQDDATEASLASKIAMYTRIWDNPTQRKYIVMGFHKSLMSDAEAGLGLCLESQIPTLIYRQCEIRFQYSGGICVSSVASRN